MLCVLNTLFLILIPARHVNNNENNHENTGIMATLKIFDPASASVLPNRRYCSGLKIIVPFTHHWNNE